MYVKDVVPSRRQIRDLIDVHNKRKFQKLNNSLYIQKHLYQLDTFDKINTTFDKFCSNFRKNSFDSLVSNAIITEKEKNDNINWP